MLVGTVFRRYEGLVVDVTISTLYPHSNKPKSVEDAKWPNDWTDTPKRDADLKGLT